MSGKNFRAELGGGGTNPQMFRSVATDVIIQEQSQEHDGCNSSSLIFKSVNCSQKHLHRRPQNLVIYTHFPIK